jgi:hypothetical protein
MEIRMAGMSEGYFDLFLGWWGWKPEKSNYGRIYVYWEGDTGLCMYQKGRETDM